MPRWINVRDMINAAVNRCVECVKDYTPYLRKPEFDRYAKSLFKEEILNEFNDLLTLAIGQDNMSPEMHEIFLVIQSCFKEIEAFAESYQRYLKLYRKY
jgi:hypothetical protein